MSFVDDVRVTWGESLRWDDRRRRLYFVDCAAQTLHWLEDAEPPLHTRQLPSVPTGIALADDGRLLICLDGGLHAVEPEDDGAPELVAPYPDGMHGRANDMTATPDGGVVTGTLNLAPGPGALYRWHRRDGWEQLDDDNGNVNGPVTFDDGSIVVGDTTTALVHRYDPTGARTTLFDHGTIGGSPDGATVDADGGVWGCSLVRGAIVRLTAAGLDRVVEVPFRQPSDVTFGGPHLDRAFVASINVDLGRGAPTVDEGRLLVLDDLGTTGVAEHRAEL